MDHPMKEPLPVTTVAGYLGYIEAWEAIEPAWNAQLVASGIDRFRLNDFRKKCLDDSWIESVRPFAQIVHDSSLLSVTASLWDADWHTIERHSEYLALCPRRQHACLDMLLNPIAETVRLEFNPGCPTLLVFDNDFDSRNAVVRLHEAWSTRTGNPRFDIFMKGDVPWESIPLQCADMLAGLSRLDTFLRGWLRSGTPQVDDNNALFEVAGLARGKRGRGTMWSDAIGKKVEAFLERDRLKPT
jgi:hypothetical protein